jgi:hypothetical protein
LIEESWQSTGAELGAASALAEEACDGWDVGWADGSGGAVSADWLETGAGLDSSVEPRELRSHQIPKIKVPTARSRVIRLIQ